MQARDINEIIARINELRAVFVLGQRAVPFLEEVFVFLREIAPLLDEINDSIRETTASMPRATSQLKSVSEATKLATTEILDLADEVQDQLSPLRQHFEEAGADLANIGQLDIEAWRIAEQAFAQHGITPPADLQKVWEERSNLLAEVQAECSRDQKAVADIRERVSRIVMSLQVQDITAQQIASSNHLIESIRTRMTALVDRLGVAPALPTEPAWPKDSPTTFDPHARYDGDSMRQEMIDEVVRKGVPAQDEPAEPQPASRAPITDALIDQLFAACEADPPRPAHSPPAAIDPGDEARASQAEIDALFRNGSSS